MPIPLLLIAGIIFFVGIIIIFIKLIPIFKLLIIVFALATIYNILPEKVKKIKNWEFAIIGISLLAALLTITSHFGFFAVGDLPFAIQEPVAQAILSPFNLLLSFIILVLIILYVKKGKK